MAAKDSAHIIVAVGKGGQVCRLIQKEGRRLSACLPENMLATVGAISFRQKENIFVTAQLNLYMNWE